MHRWQYTVLIFIVPFLISGQTTSNNGRFSVEFGRGCAPLTVNITPLDTLGTVTRVYDYLSDGSFTSSTTFTYDQPGNYQIIQILDNVFVDTLEVEVVVERIPEISIIKCGNREIWIESQDSFYDAVRIFFGGPDSLTLAPGEVTSFQFATLGPQTFGLKGLFDDADETCSTYFDEITPLEQVLTPSILSTAVKETCQDVFTLFLSLEQIQDGVNYRIVLEQLSTEILFEGSFDSTVVVLNDIPFQMSDYCIQVTALDPCNGFNITSNQFCATPTALSLSPFEELYSTYQESGIFINLDELSSGSYEILRRFEGGAFESRGLQEGPFIDPVGSSARKYFYQINYVDSCNNMLYTGVTNPPLIDAEETRDNQYRVTFTSAVNSLGNSTGESYEVGMGNTIDSEAVGNGSFEVSLNVNNGERQQLSVISTYSSGVEIRSNILNLKYELVIYVPNAFTPNGDGLNDTLEFFGVPNENALVRIYSKWGQTIYESGDLSLGWDGTVSGTVAPAGTYLYEIQFQSTDGRKLRQRGTFAVIIK